MLPCQKGVCEWSISTPVSCEILFTFHLTEKLKFNSRFPSRTKNKQICIQSIRAVDCVTGPPPPSKACKNVFMHITKSLIKSTSNCRHRNQSQLPHPRRSADCESDCESSNPPRSEWKIANMRKVEKDKRNATEGDGSSAGPGESGALFINLC